MNTGLLPSAEVAGYDIAELIAVDPREPFTEDDYSEPMEPEVECFYCGNMTRSPFRIGKRPFCCKACARDYAE